MGHGTDAVTTGSVVSVDGTRIRYRRLGRGAELVARWRKRVAAHDESRTCVADAFTVHLPDRRGRGMSGAFGSAYSIWREDEDLAAMVEHTVADCVRDDAPARRTDSLR
jgi:pimeloyl-ACP methyl ester carboxylesterase